MNELALLDVVVEEEMAASDDMVFIATSAPARLRARFGDRVRVCAISEPAMVGMAVGAAMSGLRPLVDLNRASFLMLVMDQLVNHAGRLSYLTDGAYSVPMVLTMTSRGPQQLGPQNEQCPYGLLMQVPGVAVVTPGSQEDACGLLRSALSWPGPVAYFAAPSLARSSGWGSAIAARPVPFGQARRVTEGDDATILAIGGAVAVAAEAAAELASVGVRCDVVDPRTLVPFDVETVRESVLRTGRLVVVDDGPRSGAPAQILGRLLEQPSVGERLCGRIRVVSCPDVPVPSSPALERHVWPTSDAVVDAVRELS
ncbi:transketolase C-terminal domain-containing protein [Cellulosimicrobium marinum]|uniref:transketolase C-terminal domain-containing protein n=1 Tax=Cellulosimicrobium marinum TaxID=1638992 RepID=UPI001E6091FA|nr:transketolase C-terminal domain-containing protein [Cellulosimicrobium marinum]MCB7135714.1 hypothetical protein [Cellulosimicrobium marinum]